MAGELQKVRTRYSDFKTNLDEHPLSSDVALDTNADAVKRSIRNLMLTGTYERRFRPYIGSGLQKYLFENVSPVTAQLIQDSIVTTIQNFEPRAQLISVIVTVDPDMNSYSATVKFAILNLPDTVEITQIISRIR